MLTKLLSGAEHWPASDPTMTNKKQIVDAVNFLIESPKSGRLINEMRGIIAKWKTRPVVYAGDMVILNAMLDVGIENIEAFEKLVTLIEERRKMVPQSRRLDYQKNLMRDRRLRGNKAVELHELTSKKTLTTGERKKYLDGLQARWAKARQEFIASKGELSWKDRNAASQEFWSTIDRQLDANLATARRGGKPVA